MLTRQQHNIIVVFKMIPKFNIEGNLPPGIHVCSFDLFSDRFGTSERRRRFLKGLEAAIACFEACGCRRLYVDGSFVTRKRSPNDYDVAWDPAGVNLGQLKRLEPVFFEFANKRAAQKAKYHGEFFPSSAAAEPAGRTFLEFFQIDKSSGNPKGIVALDI